MSDKVMTVVLDLLDFSATWWLQSGVLALAAILAAAALRKRGPARQSVVCRIAICAVLLCPFATQLFAVSGVSLFTINVRAVWSFGDDAAKQDQAMIEVSDAASQAAPVAVSAGYYPHLVNGPAGIAMGLDKAAFDPSIPAAESAADVARNRPEVVADAREEPALDPSLAAMTAGVPAVAIALLAAWLLGIVVLVGKSAVDLLRIRSLCRQSAPADELALEECRLAAAKLGVKATPRVLLTPFLSSPCLLGHWHPVILLPEETHQSTYSQVFLHELAHLRRADWLWHLFGRFAVALLWHQPLLLWLHRKGLAVAEEVCDDYVLHYGGSRERYLRQLLEIAERSLPTPVPAGVSMVGFRSKLGQRVSRILDTSRTLSTTVKRRFAGAAMLAAIAVTLGVAFLHVGDLPQAVAERPVAGEGPAMTPSAASADQSGGEAEGGGDARADGSRRADAIRTYEGRVLDPLGQPVSGATVTAENTYWQPDGRKVSEILASTTTSSDGSYSLTFKPAEGGNRVVAVSVGFGPAVVGFTTLHQLHQEGKSRLDLQLARDVPIRGRIIDTEGAGIPGVTIQVTEVATAKSEEAIAEWIAAERPELFQGLEEGFAMMSQDSRVTATSFPVDTTFDAAGGARDSVTTAADGGFTLNNIGEDRRVSIKISGPTIATREAFVVTREMRNVIAFGPKTIGNDFTHFGSSPTIVAGPTQPIVGRVTEAKTGMPLADVEVALLRAGGSDWLFDQPISTTDRDGRFRLIGAPLGGEHVVAVRPAPDEPYFETQLELPVASGIEPLECKFELPRTKWIAGRVIDERGEPVVAILNYYPYRDNPNAGEFANYDPQIMGSAPSYDVQSDSSGKFRIRAIAGRGVLAAFAKEQSEQAKYAPNRPDSLWERIGGQQMPKLFNGFSADLFDAMAEVDVDPEADVHPQDLVFKIGRTRRLKVTGASGEPLGSVHVLGRTFPPSLELDNQLVDSSVEVIGMKPGESRLVVLLTDDQEFGRMLEVKGEELSDLGVRLEKCATVTGRVVDRNGEPVSGLSINVSPKQEPASDNWLRRLPGGVTDSDGRFMVHLPPGGLCTVSAYTSAGPNFFAEIRRVSGARYELGDLEHDTKMEEDATAKLAKETVASNSPRTRPKQGDGGVGLVSSQEEGSLVFFGHVKHAGGAPASGAYVAALATKVDAGMWTHSEVLGEAVADGEGRYEVRFKDIAEGSYTNAHLVYRTEDSGVAWRPIDLGIASRELDEVLLPPEQQIQVRLVDLEANPAGAVAATVQALIPRSAERPTEEWLRFHKLNRVPKAWPVVTSDQNGLLTIRNIPAGVGVDLGIPASERFAPQNLTLNSGMAEERGERDATYRPVVRSVASGEVATIPLSPAKVFRGSVLLGEDGPPAANSRVEIWASQQEFGSMIIVEGQTDSQGRFELTPYPGIRFGINAFPPDDSPYQIRRIDDLRWTSVDSSKDITVTLERGVLAKGRVVDADSGEPIENASVQYVPVASNPNRSDSTVTGAEGIKVTDELGEFQITVLPGEGWLLVHADDRSYVLQQTTRRRLSSGKPGGVRIYAHAFTKIDCDAGQDFEPVEVRLQKGGVSSASVVDPDGKPIDKALAISRLTNLAAFNGLWRGVTTDTVQNGKIVFKGLAPGEAYPVHLLDAERKLGAVAMIRSDRPTTRINLQPCGAATIRFVDADGNPLAGREETLQLVVTPGASPFSKNRDEDDPVADMDYVGNIDRLNHAASASGSDGVQVISALIPGATYRYARADGSTVDFVAKSGEIHDLGVRVVTE